MSEDESKKSDPSANPAAEAAPVIEEGGAVESAPTAEQIAKFEADAAVMHGEVAAYTITPAPPAEPPAPDLTPAEAATAETSAMLEALVEADEVKPTEIIPASGYDAEPAPAVHITDKTRADVFMHLNAIEQLALFWGGPQGVDIRNRVMAIRELMKA